jgi:hypothetical protein
MNKLLEVRLISHSSSFIDYSFAFLFQLFSLIFLFRFFVGTIKQLQSIKFYCFSGCGIFLVCLGVCYLRNVQIRMEEWQVWEQLDVCSFDGSELGLFVNLLKPSGNFTYDQV